MDDSTRVDAFIPPLDGAYHTVMAGETPESIALRL